MNPVRLLAPPVRGAVRRLSGAPPPPRAQHAALLTEVRAALSAGAAPGAALAVAVLGDGLRDGGGAPGDRGGALTPPALVPLAQAVRLGRSLADAAADVDTADPALDLLVRALAVSERTGAGGVAAVDQALAAAAEHAETARRLRATTTEARATAVVLSVLPVVLWVLLVGLDPALLAFYGTPLGVADAALAIALALGGHLWARKLLARALTTGASADPLMPVRPPRDLGRGLALGLPVLVVLAISGLGLLAFAAAGALFAFGARRPRPDHLPDLARGGAAEAVELVAVGLASGLSPPAAIAAVAPLSPPAARPSLTRGGQRLQAGWSPAAAFADTGLSQMGAILAASERWGAPSEPGLRRLASELRSVRASAAAEAAERAAISLVFPTTLLTLPAFLVGVVPPLLWSALQGALG